MVNQDGQASPLPKKAGSTGWATEESLDVDMVSAVCPNCHIILVEANTPSQVNLGAGVNAAIALGAGSCRTPTAASRAPATPATMPRTTTTPAS